MSSSNKSDSRNRVAFNQSSADRRLINAPIEPEFLSGVQRVSVAPAIYNNDPKLWPIDDDGRFVPQINWGGLSLPATSSNMHFLVAGVPGTGKTIAFRALCESIFRPQLRKYLNGLDRAIIYDPKQEFVPILDACGVPHDDVAILNPFDRRTLCWNLPTDFNDAPSAVQLAKSLIPIGENLSQPFFAKASAAILAALIQCHMRKNPKGWDLADIIFDCISEDNLITRLSSMEDNVYNRSALTALARGDTRASVMAELNSGVSIYLPIAACWRKAKQEGRLLSIRHFLSRDTGILVLGANQQFSESLSPINRLFLRRFSELALDSADDSLWKGDKRTWVFLDEMKELGKIDCMANLISKGRSKGICVVIGFQDISGLKEAFGENQAKEITACCHHKLFLRLEGESAEWASTSVGQSEVMDIAISVRSGTSITASSSQNETISRGYSGGFSTYSKANQEGSTFSASLSNDVTISKQTKVKDAVLASEISGLPKFSQGGGITGFAIEYSEERETSIVRKIHIPKIKFSFLEKGSKLEGFCPWKPAELEW
jgi:hypothetical protein